MKTLLSMCVVAALVLVAGCVTPPPRTGKLAEPTLVEASCGQCHFNIDDHTHCSLAIRLDRRAYFVDGFTMEQFGDPHSPGGLCETIRKARVTGEFVNGRFAASTFELLTSQ